MSSPGNGITIHSNECVEYAPPEYSIATVSQMCDNSDKAWADYPPPPAYNTLTDLPAPCVSPSAPQFYTSPTTQQMYMQTHTPTRNIPSTPREMNVQPAASQFNSFTVIPQVTRLSVAEQLFRNGKPRSIGTWLIMSAIAQIGISVGLAMNIIDNKYYYSSKMISNGIPFLTAVFNIFTGVMALKAGAKPTKCLVISSFSCTIITLTFTCIGLAFTSLDLEDLRNLECFFIDGNFGSFNFCGSFKETVSIMYYVLIGTNVLVLLLSLYSTYMGCRALFCASQ